MQSYGADLEEITLENDSEARTINAGVSLVEADLREMENVILEFLSPQVEAVDERAITGIVEGRKGVKVKALRRLVDSRKVVRTGGGKKGDPYLYRHSGFLVPTIFPEPENRNPKQGLTDSYESANTGSAPCAQYQDVPGRQEPAFSNAELEQFDV